MEILIPFPSFSSKAKTRWLKSWGFGGERERERSGREGDVAESNGWGRVGPRRGDGGERMISIEPPWTCESTKQTPFALLLSPERSQGSV